VYIETVVNAIYHLNNVHHDDTDTQRNFNGVLAFSSPHLI